MLLVYMSTWFDDTGDDGASGDVPVGVPTQNLSRGAATIADAGPIGHNDLHDATVLWCFPLPQHHWQ